MLWATLGFGSETGRQERRQKRHVASTARASEEQIKNGSLVLFFFGGHGVEYEGFGRQGWGTTSGKMTMRRRRFLLNRAHHRDLWCNLILLDCCRCNELNDTFKNVKGLGDDGAKG